MTNNDTNDDFEPVSSGVQFWKPEDEGMTLRGLIVDYEAASDPSDNDVFTIEATTDQEVTVSDGDEGYQTIDLEEGEKLRVSGATLEEPLNQVRDTEEQLNDEKLEVLVEFVEMRKSKNGFPYRDYSVQQRTIDA